VATAGHRAWLVGGAVRNLALGLPVNDLDMASAATPDEIERLFERTKSVGKAFGTILVLVGDEVVELTTFRTEQGYSDGRRPDAVRYGTCPEEDARRRDFTCNAIYLDPLLDEPFDPMGGIADLNRRRLCCVGDPRERFAEDALRLLRLARIAAGYGLEVDPAARSAARELASRLAGVSRERVRDELAKLFGGPASGTGVALMDELGLLPVAFPDWAALEPAAPGAERVRRSSAALTALGTGAGLACGLAVLLDRLDVRTPAPAARERALGSLRLSRAEEARVRALWALRERLAVDRTLRDERPGRRAARLQLLRDPAWPEARRVVLAWGAAAPSGPDGVELVAELDRLAERTTAAELRPAPLLRADDLTAAGLPRGPLWGSVLREAEALQLDGALSDRAAALAWLAERARQLAQEGGNARRSR